VADSHRARKRFGQHFLHDEGVIGRIIRAIDPKPGEPLIEIGPGLGALTFPLLERSKTLTVIELDRDVTPRLRAACKDPAALTIIEVP
jgi:16S rRNA (adenine1518-N6/adenine1519-N6)-dimethyltransferase